MARTTPPSTRSAAPLVAGVSGKYTYTIVFGQSVSTRLNDDERDRATATITAPPCSPDRPGRDFGARVSPLCRTPAGVRSGLRRGHALGAGGLPRHRPAPARGIDVGHCPVVAVVLGSDRVEPT